MSPKRLQSVLKHARYFIGPTKEIRLTEKEIQDKHLETFTWQFLLGWVLLSVANIIWSWELFWWISAAWLALAVLLVKLYYLQYHAYDNSDKCPSCQGSGFARAFTVKITHDEKGFRSQEKHLGYFPCRDQFHTYERIGFKIMSKDVLADWVIFPSFYDAFVDVHAATEIGRAHV